MGKLLVLNHKMNMEYDEVYPYIDGLNKLDTDDNFVVCPSNIYLTDYINHSVWGIGAQNVCGYDKGDYTGEVSALQLKSLGVEYCLIGHYERKKYFHETEKEIRMKLIACLESNIMPILCFGESGNIDEVKKTLDIILDGIENIDFIVFAYEPLKVKDVSTIEDIKNIICEIYDYLFDKYHSKPNIIYGGGISSKEVPLLLKIDKLNGLLIGKNSTNIETVKKISNREVK